jgi:quercetin dioxygenase-like cupin family protein
VTAFERIADVAPQLVWEGVTGRAVHAERLTLGLIELDADAVVPEHAHDNEQVGILVEGSFVMRVGDETRELARGDTWRIPSNAPHEVRVGPQGAVVIEVWVPAREDWKAIEPGEPSVPRVFS